MTSGRFKPGQSGNKTGKPRGPGQAGRLRAAMADKLDAVVDVLILKAMAGDTQAAGLLLSRCLPPLKPAGEVVSVRMPKGSMTDQARAVVRSMASGRIPEGQGVALVNALASITKMKSIEDITAEVEAIRAELEEVKHAVDKNKTR